MDQCPKLPVIPNSREEFVKRGPVNGSMEYICKSGYQMRDPITNNQSDGVIRCIDGAWSPYPYPVCKPLGKPLVVNSKYDVSKTTVLDKRKIRRQDFTNTDTFTLITHEVVETNIVSKPAKEEQVEIPVQFDLTFVITVFSLVVLGSVSGSVLMIICIKLIRRHSSRSKEIRYDEYSRVHSQVHLIFQLFT